jgi:hypothetical protein
MMLNYLLCCALKIRDFCTQPIKRIPRINVTLQLKNISMRINLFLSLIVALATTYSAQSQLSSSSTFINVTCAGDSNGSITFSGVEACFAPITVVLDSMPPMSFNTLKNDGYDYINHGTGTGGDLALGVASGSTSIGDVYVTTGWFKDSISFDTLTVYGNGGSSESAFMACFDAATNQVLWLDAATSGSGTYNRAYGVDLIGDKAYVVGYFEGTANFNSATIVSTGSYQGFIAKYDIPTGLIDTVIQVGNAGLDECSNIRAGADNRLYVTGDFTGSISLAGNNYSTNGSYDAFVTCYDSSLATNYWATTGGGSGVDIAADIVPYTENGVTQHAYLVGYIGGNATFGSNSLTTAGGQDFYVAKVDTLGNWIWAKRGGGTSTDNAFTIDVNSTGDRLYVGGQWRNTMTFGGQNFTSNGNADGFIAYLDTAGALDDLYQIGGTGLDGVYDLQSIDDDYLVFAAGIVGTWTYADSTFVSNGGVDAFAAKIGPDQHEIWGKNFGSAGTNGDAFNSISAGPNKRLHCAGYIGSNASFYQAGLIAVGSSDAIVANGTIMGFADTTIVLSNLGGGEHYITMTDSNGNVVIDTIIISEPNPISITGVVTNASSGGSSDGEIDITVTGGTPGYTFLWSNAATTEDVTGLAYGSYTVTVTDSNGCIDTASFLIDTTLSIFGVTAQITNLACGGDSSGAIDLTVTGGTTPYTFAWSTGASSEDISGLDGGVYTVTVTDSDTNSYIDSFTVTEPAPIMISGTITSPSTGTATDGAIDVTVSGGTPPYAFLWSNSATTEDLSGIGIGNYTITVTDSTGCSASAFFLVDTVASLNLALTSSDVTCTGTDNGAIDLTVIGGVSPYSFAWSNGATTEDISALAAGTYTVTVTDNASQVASESAIIVSNPIYPDPIVGPITGAASAQAWLSYTYNVPATTGSNFVWTASIGTVQSAASNTASILWNAGPSGAVYVSETDANGCSAVDSLEVTILFVGIDESDENAILVYPNPTKDQLHIELPSSFANPTLTINDISGRMVYTSRTNSLMNTVDVSDFKPGMYILHLTIGDTNISHKFIVD